MSLGVRARARTAATAGLAAVLVAGACRAPLRRPEAGETGAPDAPGVEYRNGWRELYDLQTDPHELTNLANLRRLAWLRTKLSRRLAGLLSAPSGSSSRSST
jgi:hypothetical protein